MANTTVANPLQLASDVNSPLDPRQKLIISGEEPTLDELQTIVNPYFHMEVHCHKQTTDESGNVTEECMGVWTVDTLTKIKIGAKYYTRVGTYHKSYNADGTATSSSIPADLTSNVDALMAKCFPLEVSASANNATVEEDTEVTPTITLDIIRQSKDVSSTATVVVTSPESGVTVSEDNKTITGTATSTGGYSIKATVTQGGQSVDVEKSWAWSNYRYYGVLDSAPADADEIVHLIESSNSGASDAKLSKELSTSAVKSGITIPVGKCYLFAVKDTHTFKVTDTDTGFALSGFDSVALADVPQANNSDTKNSYTYIVITAGGAETHVKIYE